MPTLTERVNLDDLDDFLNSDGAPDECRSLSFLDGLLTGVVVGPELIMPYEWLPEIWGGGEAIFVDAAEAQLIFGLIMARYIEITHTLDSNPDDFVPMFWESREGHIIVSEWADGFIAAIRLRREAWKPLIQHPEACSLILGIAFFANYDLGYLPFDVRAFPEDAAEQMHEDQVDIIPECVMSISAFWGSWQAHSDCIPTRRGRRKSQLTECSDENLTRTLRVSCGRRLYRDIEMGVDASLEDLARAIVHAFNFDFEHAYGFYSHFRMPFWSPVRYELFGDVWDGELFRSVKLTKVSQAFPRFGSRMLFLYDYGNDTRFKVEVIDLGTEVPMVKYPRVIETMGIAPPQYPDLDEEDE